MYIQGKLLGLLFTYLSDTLGDFFNILLAVIIPHATPAYLFIARCCFFHEAFGGSFAAKLT